MPHVKLTAVVDGLLILALLLLCLVCRPSFTSSAMTATVQVPPASVMRMHVFTATHAQRETHRVSVDHHRQLRLIHIGLFCPVLPT
jgi:hypothetical protein